MPNHSRSTTVSNERPAYKTEAEDAPTFVWDTVHQTVIKFVEPLWYQQAIAAPDHSEAVLVAMQRLVAMISTLRSSPLFSPETASREALNEAQTLEALLPYVSEEAYDVLEALQVGEQCQAIATSDQSSAVSLTSILNTLYPSFPSPFIPSSPHLITTIETLIPSLLWELARSSYSAMQLIEGVRAKCWQSERDWSSGMLRLVVMLEAETPTERWCFDLATGYPAEKLLEPHAIVQADECVLPIRQTAAEDGLTDSACQVKHQLEALVQSLQTERFGFKALLQGAAVERLQPGLDWQAGTLRLRLGFEFSTQASGAGSYESVPMHPELIEAELMEDVGGTTQNRPSQLSAAAHTRTIAALMTQTHVAVVAPLGRVISQTTLVRLTEADRLERYTKRIMQQQLAQSLVQRQHQPTSSDDESALLTLIVQAAIAYACQLGTPGVGFSQPVLLMDEFVPQLLWSLTSSTYEIMQLLGGIPAHLLQPNALWQQGTLRLVATLHLKAADVDYRLDLATGRSVLTNTTQLAADAIIHTNICSQPTLIATLTAQLQQQLNDAMLAYQLLRDGVAIVWLEEVEQDWQPGSMKLCLSLAFVADAL